MAIFLPNGSTISVASAYGTSTVTTAVSNATEAVAALTSATGFTVGAIAEITSGWSKLNSRIARIKTIATLNATLEGIDTTSTTKYPAGSGTGSARPISTWTQVSQVLDSAASGGDQQFTTYSFLEDATERQIPTTKSAESFSLTLGDDSTLPWYSVLSTADEDKLPRAVRIVLASGAVIYYNCYVTLKKTPSLTKNQVMALQATFSLVSDTTRYTS